MITFVDVKNLKSGFQQCYFRRPFDYSCLCNLNSLEYYLEAWKNMIDPICFLFFQNIDVICMPKPGDFEHHERVANEAKNSNSNNNNNNSHGDGGGGDGDDHKCYVTGWGRRTESKIDFKKMNYFHIIFTC